MDFRVSLLQLLAVLREPVLSDRALNNALSQRGGPNLGAPPRYVPIRYSYRSRSLSTVLGVFGTIGLHALAFQAIVLGAHTLRSRPPDSGGPGATAIKSEADPALTLVIVELPGTLRREADLLEEIASVGAPPKGVPITVISADPLPSIAAVKELQEQDPEVPVSHDAGDPLGQAAQFALYTGQIDARIERAWRRPRSPVNGETGVLGRAPVQDSNVQAVVDETFKCQVKILQDTDGNVLETLLLKCNGTEEWQHSLIVAINQSSPLPAPPSATVFSDALTMTFTATAYSSGRALDDYAPEERSSQIVSVMRPLAPISPEDQRVLRTEASAAEASDTAVPQ